MSQILYRLWRLPLRHAIWLLLPLQILVVWVCYQGWEAKRVFDAYDCKAWGVTPPQDFDQSLYFMRDEFRKNVSRMMAPPMPVNDGLETFALTMDRESLVMLNANLPSSGKKRSFRGFLKTDEGRAPVKARYMGDSHWHWFYEHKSWRIKTPKGDPLRDTRAFNLKNPPTSLVVEEAFISDLSRELGLLAPEIVPIKLLVNDSYSGVSLYWPLPDESLLRRSRRMPGSIYRGDGAPAGQNGVSKLWYFTMYWDKVASRNAEQEYYREDIENLIEVMNQDDPQAFHDFAERHLELDQWIKYVSIDRLFGCNHHDYYHNHHLYFDPYKGRWEPIMWDYGTWHLGHRPRDLDSTRFPILNKIRRHPEYELRLQAKLYQLLTEVMPVEELEQRWDAWYQLIEPALAADARRDHRDWPGFNLLRLQKIHCTFFSMDDYRANLAELKQQYRDRHAWLLRRLDRSILSYRLGQADQGVHGLDLMADGLVGLAISELRVPAGDGRVTLRRDSNMNGRLDVGDELVAEAMADDGVASLAMAESLYPGLRAVDRIDSETYAHGLFVFKNTYLLYPYFLEVEGGLQGEIGIEAANLVTGSRVESTQVDSVPPRFGVYPYSLHPWKLKKSRAPEHVQLGPGKVHVTRTRVFAAETAVTIVAGTVLELDPDVSLFFEGPVTAEGTAESPIVIKQAVPGSPWGVFDLHGAGTAGSRLRHCKFTGGSVAERGMVRRSGMVTVIDTSDIQIVDCQIGANHVGDDAMHWGYVQGGLLRGCSFVAARSDALDLDICEDVRIEDCEFQGSGNDGIDLMTSIVTIANCRFVEIGDKGISAGEASTLDLRSSTFTDCLIGLEIKDDSEARVDAATSFFSCEIAVNLYRKNVRYSQGGRLLAPLLNTTDCDRDWRADKRSSVEIGGLLLAR